MLMESALKPQEGPDTPKTYKVRKKGAKSADEPDKPRRYTVIRKGAKPSGENRCKV